MFSTLAYLEQHHLSLVAWALVACAIFAAVGAGMLGMDRIKTRSTLAAMRESLSCTPSPLALYDANHRLTFWNEGYAAFLRTWAMEPKAGVHLRAFLAPVGDEAAADLIYAQMMQMVGQDMPAFRAPDGRWRQGRLGRTVDGGLVHLLHDVTIEVDALEAAEAANRAKSEFLANMSHEIRTPLNAVLGLAHVMRARGLEPEQARRLDLIEEAGEALSTLFSNVLDLSSIEAGRMTLQDHAFELRALVDQTAAGAAAEAARKGLGFSIDLDDSAAVRWRGDEGKIRRVLKALLSNAVKFTMAGEVGLHATASQGGLLIKIHDTGIGMAADQKARIFEPFVQADSSSTRPFGGAGLGLAVARRLVDLMGGRLEFASTPGVGSSFSVWLPTIIAAYEPALGLGGGQHADLKILAAEDNFANQMVLKAILEPLGVELAMACDGRQAVAAFERERFDVVLMDIQMPQMNGVDAAAQMRRREAEDGRSRTPILAVTANASCEQVQTYLRAGMDAVVTKPIAASALLHAIQAAISPAPRTGVADDVQIHAA